MSANDISANGRSEGYPKCCIQAFVRDLDAHVAPASVRWALPGYVPCPTCAIAFRALLP